MLKRGAAFSHLQSLATVVEFPKISPTFFALHWQKWSHTIRQHSEKEEGQENALKNTVFPTWGSFLIRHHQVRHGSKKVNLGTGRRMDQFFAKVYGNATRLTTMARHIAVEWDFDKNEGCSHPDTIMGTAVKPQFWLCHHCDCSWLAPPEKRVVRGMGCPKCGCNGVGTLPTTDVRKDSFEIKKEKEEGSDQEEAELLKGEKDVSLRQRKNAISRTHTHGD